VIFECFFFLSFLLIDSDLMSQIVGLSRVVDEIGSAYIHEVHNICMI